MPANKLIALPPNFITGSSADFRQWLKYKRMSDDLSNVTPEDVSIDDDDEMIKPVAKPGENIERMKAYLVTIPQGATAKEIAKATGISEHSVYSALKYSAGSIVSGEVSRTNKGKRKLWKMKERVSA